MRPLIQHALIPRWNNECLSILVVIGGISPIKQLVPHAKTSNLFTGINDNNTYRHRCQVSPQMIVWRKKIGGVEWK